MLLRIAMALSLLVLPGARTAPKTGDCLEQLGAEIDRNIRDARSNFGGAVVIEISGKSVLARGYGYANRDAKTPFTPDTTAQIGSITKTFTALAVAQLVADGLIDLSSPVSRYLPEAPEPAASRTVEQLLGHTSGLVDTCGDDFAPLSKVQFLRTCMSRPLVKTPGERNYSNANYTLLAAIIEAVTSQSWEDVQRKRIWEPLRMTSAGFSFNGQPGAGFAHGYKNRRKYEPISSDLAPMHGQDWNLRGAGGMQVSPRDMIRFLRALVHGDPAINEKTRQLISTPPVAPEKQVAWGYGLVFRYLDDGRPHRTVYTGSDGIFYSYLAWYPQSDTLLYFVSNSGEQDAIRLFRSAIQAPLERGLGLAN